jgi:hypothetical protein
VWSLDPSLTVFINPELLRLARVTQFWEKAVYFHFLLGNLALCIFPEFEIALKKYKINNFCPLFTIFVQI